VTGSFAYVTLVTNADYARGATALVRSLKLTRTGADIVVMYTDGVDRAALAPLEALGAICLKAREMPVSEPFKVRHERARIHAKNPFTKGRKPGFHTPLDNFCKLRLWELVQYERVVFIDSDAIAVRNIDRLFHYEQFTAAPNVYETRADFHRLNSGVFVAHPSLETFQRMVERLDAPDAYWPRTDQTFLETFFPDWHGLPVFFNMLQYVWFNLPELWDWKSIHVVHYQYEKPWEHPHPRADDLQPLIALWQAYYTGQGIPDIDRLPNPLKLANPVKAA
jgi:alpha-N-acetylglucosamine transferase